MKTEQERLEEWKLKRLVSHYSELGFKIYANYKDYEAPFKIGKYTPDLIVDNGDQKIIIEIVTKESLNKRKEKIKHFSEFANINDKYRFDLVFTKKRPRTKKRRELTSKKILNYTQKRIKNEIENLIKEEQYDSAFSLMSILLESLLRELAMKNNLDVKGKTKNYKLVTDLYNNQIISKANYQLINDIFSLRNKFVHNKVYPNEAELNSYFEFISNFIKVI